MTTEGSSTRDRDLCMEFMASPEIGARIAEGWTTIVVPCGAIEQHGVHLPLCMDSDHADRLGVLVARRLGRSLVAPTVRVGCSAHHLAFAGTISLSNDTFEAICRDYCASLAQHGFKRILLFSAHIGNFPVLADMLPRLRETVAGRCRVDAFVDAVSWLQTWRDAVTAAGGDGDKVGGHADIAETSLMLVLRPDCVAMDRAQPGRTGLMTADELAAMWRHGLRSISPSGILGDPTGATRDIGERCLTAISDLLGDRFLDPPP